MADGRGGGQGAYHRLYTIYLAILTIQIQVPVERRFDVGAALLGPMPRKSNTTCILHPSIEKSEGPQT